MKKFFIVFLFFLSQNLFSQEIILFKRWNTEVVLPNAEWFKSDSIKILKDKIDRESYLFRRKPIVDSKGVTIIPCIGIIFEAYSDSMNVINYMFLKEMSKEARYDTMYYVIDNKTSNFLKLKMAIGKKIGYYDNYERLHIVYRIFITHGKMGIQVICDATEEVFEIIENEFEKFISNIKFKS